MKKRSRACLALILLVPAPSLGALCGMVLFPDSLVGKMLFAVSKVWLVAFPIAWLVLADKGRVSLSPVRKGGLWVGVISGVAIAVVITGAFVLCGDRWFDVDGLVAQLRHIGLAAPLLFAGASLYWITVNSILEEYVWRWFCLVKLEEVLSPKAAVPVSALFFTFHHIVALSVLMPFAGMLISCTGVFLGGLIWSILYERYESIWPAYISHAIADIAVFGIGAWLLFS